MATDSNSDLGESPLLETSINEREYKAAHETISTPKKQPNVTPKANTSNTPPPQKSNILNSLYSKRIGEKRGRPTTQPHRENLEPTNPAKEGQRIHQQQSMARNQFVPPAPAEETVFQEAQIIDDAPEMEWKEPDWDSETSDSSSSSSSDSSFRDLPKDSMNKSVNATAQLIVSFIEKLVPEAAAFVANINEDQAYDLEKEGEIIEGSLDKIVENNRSQKKDYQISQADADQLVETLSEMLNSKGTELSPEARLAILLVIILIPIGLAAFQNKKRNKRFLEQLLAETKNEVTGFRNQLSNEMNTARSEFQNEIGGMKSELDRQRREVAERQAAMEQERARFDKERNDFFNQQKKKEPQSVEAEEVN